MCNIPRRRVPPVLLFSGIFLVYALRVCVSTTAQVPPPGSTVVTMYSEFGWDGKKQGAVLAAFFYGYVLTQIPGAMVATKIGGRRVFAVGILLSAIGTLLTPFAASRLWTIIIARALTGLGEGVTYPAMVALLAKWTPASERSGAMAFCSAGAYFGTACSLPLCSEIMTRYGWRSVFWGLGGTAIVWLIPFLLLVHDSPEQCPGITPEEIALIRGYTIGGGGKEPGVHQRVSQCDDSESATDGEYDSRAELNLVAASGYASGYGSDGSMGELERGGDEGTAGDLGNAAFVVVPIEGKGGGSGGNNGEGSMLRAAKRDARILCMLLVRPGIWAATVCACSYSWMFYTLLTELPSYFTSVLHVSVRESNIASVLPWFVIFLSTAGGGQICDAMILRGVLSRRNARRFFAVAGLLPASALLVATAYVRNSNIVAIAMMTASMGALGLAISSWSVNALDIGGAYAGVAYAWVNTVSNIMGAIAPIVCGAFTDALGDEAGYTSVFWLSAVINIVGSIVFVAFVSVEPIDKVFDAVERKKHTPPKPKVSRR